MIYADMCDIRRYVCYIRQYGYTISILNQVVAGTFNLQQDASLEDFNKKRIELAQGKAEKIRAMLDAGDKQNVMMSARKRGYTLKVYAVDLVERYALYLKLVTDEHDWEEVLGSLP